MWRHELSKSNRVAGIPRTLLKIRVVSVLGNYDYIPTLSLMADGVMKLDVEMVRLHLNLLQTVHHLVRSSRSLLFLFSLLYFALYCTILYRVDTSRRGTVLMLLKTKIKNHLFLVQGYIIIWPAYSMIISLA